MAIVNVPINTGSVVSVDEQMVNSKFLNCFVGEDNKVFSTPGQKLIIALNNARAIWYTPFNGGSYLVVTDTAIERVTLVGTKQTIATIPNSSQPVQIAENMKNQLCICDGLNAYILTQSTTIADKLTTLDSTVGFDLTNPITCTELNTSFIVGSANGGKFQVSSPNDGLTWSVFDEAQIESALTSLVCLTTFKNNLFVLGGSAIERWVPNMVTLNQPFPFTRDNSYRTDYGCISTDSVVSNIDAVVWLSDDYKVMMMDETGVKPLTDSGLTHLFSKYDAAASSHGSFYTAKGQWIYHLYFPNSADNGGDVSWIYNLNSQKWSQVDYHVISSLGTYLTDAVRNVPVVGFADGFYQLTDEQQADRFFTVRSLMLDIPAAQRNSFRQKISNIVAEVVQGKVQESTDEPQHLIMRFSRDNLTWSNAITSRLGETGQRENITRWSIQSAVEGSVGFEITYYGKLDLTLKSLTFQLN